MAKFIKVVMVNDAYRCEMGQSGLYLSSVYIDMYFFKEK